VFSGEGVCAYEPRGGAGRAATKASRVDARDPASHNAKAVHGTNAPAPPA